MSKSSIIDTTISIKPSTKLIEFIQSLDVNESMPENVAKIYNAYNGGAIGPKIQIQKDIPNAQYTKNEIEILKTLRESDNDEDTKSQVNIENKLIELLELADENPDDDDDDEHNLNEEIETIESDTKSLSKTQLKKLKEQQKERLRSQLILKLNDIKWIDAIAKEQRSNDNECAVYLHQLLAGSRLILPKNEIIPRNPELEARCKILRLRQDARKYQNMTRNVDSSKRYFAEDTISYQVRQINRQLIAVLQFVFSVAAGFAFGFIGVELIVGNLDFGFRLLLGIMCALIIALAEIYFLAKRLNEEYDLSVEEPSIVPNKSETDVTVVSKPATNGNKEHAE